MPAWRGDKRQGACFPITSAAHLHRSLVCLTTVDTTGRTALHSAVKSKAAGFSRFFSKLRGKREADPEVLHLLGLQPLQVSILYIHCDLLYVVPQQMSTDFHSLTAEDLNSVTTHRDIELVVTRWPSLDLGSVVDRDGNTLLHEAAYSGRVQLVEFLTKRLQQVNPINSFGLTPLHLALAGGHTGVAEALRARGAENVSADDDSWMRVGEEKWEGDGGVCIDQSCSRQGVDDDAWRRYLASGWVHPSDIPNTLSGCEISSRSGGMTGEEFRSTFYAHYRPVVLKGLMESWPAWEHWTRDALLEK